MARISNFSFASLSRRLFALSLLFLWLPACRQAPPRPNIVVIVVDAMATGHLPFYGYAVNTAPFLNSLSGQSSVFVNAYATSSWTVPTVASLFTSIYPFQQEEDGVGLSGTTGGIAAGKIRYHALAASVPTMAEILKQSGYRTYGLTSNMFLTEDRGFARGFDRFHSFPMKTEAQRLNRKLREWSGEMKASPYFLYIHYTDAHVPYSGRPPFYRPQKERKADLTARYDSNISYVDHCLKRLFSEMGWSRDTVLVVTADHGEEFWEHGIRGHGKNLFRGAVQVPLLLYFPENSRQGQRVERNVSSLDLLPTLCEIIGKPAPPQAEGMSLLPAVRGNSEYLEGRALYLSLKHGKYRYQGVICDNWKWTVERTTGVQLLFDLKSDPQEKVNLAESKEFIRIRIELAGLFSAFERDCRKYKTKKMQMKLSPERIRDLKTFGYLE